MANTSYKSLALLLGVVTAVEWLFYWQREAMGVPAACVGPLLLGTTVAKFVAAVAWLMRHGSVRPWWQKAYLASVVMFGGAWILAVSSLRDSL